MSMMASRPDDGAPARAWNDPAWNPPVDDDSDPVTSVRVSVDYGAELPLWGVDWWQLGLSVDLLNDLADWQQKFDTDFHWETGWASRELAESWTRRGGELAAELRSQLPPTISVEIDLWPVPRQRRRRWDRRHGV